MVSAQRGNRDAYAKFLSEVSVLLRGYVGRRINGADEVEDVLQEVLISLHLVRHTYVPGRPVGPWLYAIADHRIADSFRRARRMDKGKCELSDEVADSGGRHFHRDPRGEAIRHALTKLPQVQRRVIEMMKIEELPVREVAAHMGMSESLVKVTAFRGYETLRRILGVTKKSEQTT